jgi:hypothetical protein
MKKKNEALFKHNVEQDLKRAIVIKMINEYQYRLVYYTDRSHDLLEQKILIDNISNVINCKC